MTEPLHVNSPLVVLRVSMARNALKLGIGQHIPGLSLVSDPSFAQLTNAAIAHPRGWNALLGRIGVVVEELQRECSSAQKGVLDAYTQMADLIEEVERLKTH